jgi:hypothetical protein
VVEAVLVAPASKEFNDRMVLSEKIRRSKMECTIISLILCENPFAHILHDAVSLPSGSLMLALENDPPMMYVMRVLAIL